MKTNFRKDVLVSILIAICLTISACAQAVPADQMVKVEMAGGIPDGSVVALGLVDTIRYLSQVVNGSPLTGVMSNAAGDQFLLYWTMNTNVGFFGITADGNPVSVIAKFCGSNCANPFSFTDLYKGLAAQGWKDASPADLPNWITLTFGSVSAFMTTYGKIMASPIPMIIVVPGGNFANPYNTGNG